MNRPDHSHLHTFAVCAYGDSPFLKECLESLKQQTVKSRILLATSTPSPFLEGIAREYELEYHISPRKGEGIAADWEFALQCASTPYCTITHQDDLYLPEYAERVVAALEDSASSLICFTNNADKMPDGRILKNRFYLIVKRLLLLPFYLKRSWSSRFVKLWILRFGNSICCPSVTYNLARLKEVKFDRNFTVNLDWAMWLELARRKGSFVYLRKVLFCHRLSSLMESSAAIADSRRFREDQQIFSALWPGLIAGLLLRFYSRCYKSNVSK